jgi:thiosulfate/3-mercaptopyruvate sulfurtransferase
MRLALLVVSALFAASAAKAQPLVSADWLNQHLADPNVVVIDIRKAAEHEGGHVPRSVSADYERTGWRVKLPDGSGGALPPISQIGVTIGRLGVSDADHAVIVGDDFGAAARVYWTFRVLGHDDVSILDGGWRGWQDGHFPVQAGPEVRTQAVFTPRYNPALRAELGEVEQAVRTGSEALVDARPPAQWLGESKTSAVREYGHLPGAVWVDQSEALTPEGSVKPRDQLADVFSRVGDKPATAYCNTGHLAATDWFVLSEILGRPGTKLYDGSMSQWTADSSRPVER